MRIFSCSCSHRNIIFVCMFNRNFTPEPKHIICFIFLLMYLLSDRNVAPGHEALNSVVPQSDSFEEHSFLSSELLPASSRNSLPVSLDLFSPCDPSLKGSLLLHLQPQLGALVFIKKLQEEACECLDEDLPDNHCSHLIF